MNIKHLLTITAAAAVLAAASVPARAADEVDDARPHAGVSIGGQANRYFNSHELSNDWYGGANVRFHFTEVLALEASADYRKTNGSDQYPAQGSLMFYLWPHRFAPYILGGGTWYFHDGGPATHTLFGPHAGAGVEFYLIRHVALDVNWRYHWVENFPSGGNYFSKSYSGDGNQWRFGANFYF